MSYGLQIAGDADVEMRRLDPWLQEEVLDELERLIADPSLLHQGENILSVTRTQRGQRFHVTLYLAVSEQSQTVSLLGVSQLAL